MTDLVLPASAEPSTRLVACTTWIPNVMPARAQRVASVLFILSNRYFLALASTIAVKFDVCIIWPAWVGDHGFRGPELYTEYRGHTAMSQYPDARFLKSADAEKQFVEDAGREVAFALESEVVWTSNSLCLWFSR